MIVERADIVLCVEARCFHSFLWIHAKLDHVQQYLKQGLVLVVTTRRAQHHKRLAALENKRRRQRDSRPLTGRYDVWTVWVSKRVLNSLAHQHAGIAGYDCGQPCAARRCTKHVAILIY